MVQPLPEKNRRVLRTLLGFLLGVLLCLVNLFICGPLGGIIGFNKGRMFAVLYGVVLLGTGTIALRRAESALAQGILIAVSVALLLDGTAGVFLAN